LAGKRLLCLLLGTTSRVHLPRRHIDLFYGLNLSANTEDLTPH